MDLLAQAFAKHPFWPMKALKEEVRQPEAYLREVLNKIAFLTRNGVYANTWHLKPSVVGAVELTDADMAKYEQEIMQSVKPEDVAPDVGTEDDDDDDMEDVLLD
jgi:transcription initiation factor TFIIF subunit beta